MFLEKLSERRIPDCNHHGASLGVNFELPHIHEGNDESKHVGSNVVAGWWKDLIWRGRAVGS